MIWNKYFHPPADSYHLPAKCQPPRVFHKKYRVVFDFICDFSSPLNSYSEDIFSGRKMQDMFMLNDFALVVYGSTITQWNGDGVPTMSWNLSFVLDLSLRIPYSAFPDFTYRDKRCWVFVT